MTGEDAARMVRKERIYLQNILKDFKAEQGDFRPAEGMMNVAQQVYHIAHTVRWFREGAFGEGFNMDFEALEAVNQAPVSLEEAMGVLDKEYDSYAAFLEGQSEADLAAPIPPNPVFGEAPRFVVIFAQMDHTAHHRGSLAVYLRLLGVKPTMIYEE